jgi:DNA repair protein RadC
MLPNLSDRERGTLRRAADILARYLKSAPVMDSPKIVREVLSCKLGHQSREVFAVLYLNAQHELIEYVEEFFGTLSVTSVYPRELVKRALALNAGAVVLAHNHPSGKPEPSAADEALTRSLSKALSMVDVRMLDHIVVAGGQFVSFAERGLL